MGCGNGAMFVSLVQLIAGWFPAHRNPECRSSLGSRAAAAGLVSAF